MLEYRVNKTVDYILLNEADKGYSKYDTRKWCSFTAEDLTTLRTDVKGQKIREDLAALKARIGELRKRYLIAGYDLILIYDHKNPTTLKIKPVPIEVE